MKKRLLIILLLPFLSFGQTQIGEDIDGESAGDQSGFSLDLSSDGSVMAIAAPLNDGNIEDSGHVRIYENQGGTWVQIGEDIDGEAEDDVSGFSVDLSSDGSLVAIGAIQNDENGDNSGHVRIYENQEGTWIQIGEDIDGESAGDQSGISVSLSNDGSIVAIGANGNDGNGNASGHTRIYENQGGTWTQIGQDIDGESGADLSGRSVSLSSDGSLVAIGAIRNDDNNADSGQVRIFENQDGTWTQVGEDIDGEGIDDRSGTSVSLSSDGSVVAIGAPRNDDNGADSGHVRIFENQGGTWTQIGENINGESAGDQSGTSVSLLSDGNAVAISAPFNDGNGTNSGHVRVFENQEGIWTQVGEDIDGETADDQSGTSVSLSGVLAIGAIGNDDTGENSGHVRVFDLSDVLSTEEITQTSFKLFPNPASTNITIQLDQNSSLEKATIYNSLGQVVHTSIETTIDTSDLSNGIYILEVITDQGKASKKLIIE